MRKGRFNRNQIDIKRVLYISGGIIILGIIAFFAIFLISGTSDNGEQLARMNTSLFDDYSSNSVEETSSSMGRTVNEMQNENTVEENTVDENNTVTNESTSENVTKENSSTSKSNNETEKEEEEEVKDPEFTMPVEGEIIKEFAQENLVYSTTLDEWITHNGIDIAAEKTTVVKASAEGKVKSIKNDPRYGLTVVIEHVNGYQTVYSNLLTAEFIEEGETVEAGQTIATVGNTATFEIADESHLHFEIIKDNEYMDPELYIK